MAEWQETMERLVRDRERALLGYAYMVCGDATGAQDLVQEALIKTFSRPRPGLSPLKAEGYVRRAITSVYVDQYRRNQRWNRVQHLFGGNSEGADAGIGVEMHADISIALGTLPPRERACIMLRFFDDMTVPQIGRQLGLAPGTVKRYLSDAVGKLELILGPLDDAGDIDTVAVTDRANRRNDERNYS